MAILETDGPAALITLDRIEARDAVDRPEADPALRAVVLRGAGPVLRAGMDLAPEVFNRAAPDTGNMEALARYGTPEQQERWLRPLLAGEIRSSFAMTEPEAASSDARNIESAIRRDGRADVVSGREWRMTGATDPRCRIVVVMGKTDPAAEPYRQRSMILVPRDAPGVAAVRSLPVFGLDGMPDRASEVVLRDVRVRLSNTLLGEGRARPPLPAADRPGRAGAREDVPARHPARGLRGARVRAGRDAREVGQRGQQGGAGRDRHDQGGRAVHGLPGHGQVMDWAIQAFGGGGTSNDSGLADGPDELRRDQLARLGLKRQPARTDGGRGEWGLGAQSAGTAPATGGSWTSSSRSIMRRTWPRALRSPPRRRRPGWPRRCAGRTPRAPRAA